MSGATKSAEAWAEMGRSAGRSAPATVSDDKADIYRKIMEFSGLTEVRLRALDAGTQEPLSPKEEL